jgi:hypothetical protein
VDTTVKALVDGILVPVISATTAPIPFLASSGLLLLLFGTLWVAFAATLARDPRRVDDTWNRLRAAPVIVRALAWLLFLPVLAGVWIWRTSWPKVARLTAITGLAGWNLLVFLPGPR